MCRATVLFSVAPSHSPTGNFVPSAVIAGATTQQCSAMCSPSIINTLMSSPVRSRVSSSARAVLVCAMNRRLTAERLVALATSATACPTGSAAATCRRVANPASIRSITTRVS
jgi:hypothetical protein